MTAPAVHPALSDRMAQTASTGSPSAAGAVRPRGRPIADRAADDGVRTGP